MIKPAAAGGLLTVGKMILSFVHVTWRDSSDGSRKTELSKQNICVTGGGAWGGKFGAELRRSSNSTVVLFATNVADSLWTMITKQGYTARCFAFNVTQYWV